MASQFFKIFRSGTHTTMAGETLTFTTADVEKTARFYPASGKVAPLVLGHPADDQPVMGAVRALHAKGEALFAEADVSSALTDLVRKGRYLSVSAAFFRPANDPRNPVPGVWSLRHVGFLGAHPPAVKGLGPLQFAEHDAAMLTGDALALAFMDLRGASGQVSFAEAAQGALPMARHREAMHRAAQRITTAHPEFTYVEAVRVLEASTGAGPF